jgi:UDP-N-acetylenolpyruvoylglucosamine reductase
LDLQTLYAPVQGNARAKKWEWVGRGVAGRVWGTFGIALEMEMRKIPNKSKKIY